MMSAFETRYSYEEYEHFKIAAPKINLPNIGKTVQQVTQQAKAEINKAITNIQQTVPPAVKKAVEAAKTPAQKLATIATQATGKAKEAATLALIVPYYPIMRVAIKEKGIAPQKDPKELIKQFYTVVMGKKADYTMEDSRAFEAYLWMGKGPNGEHFDFVALIPIILAFLTAFMSQQKAQGKMTPEAEQAAKDSEEMMKIATDEDTDIPMGDPEAPGGINDNGGDPKGNGKNGKDDDKKKSGAGKLIGLTALGGLAYLLFK